MEIHDYEAWWIAGGFAILSTLLTFYQIRGHIKYNSHRKLRKHVIRIIGMVPIYALESWLGLRFVHAALYFDVLRECYEAFVIYSFYQLLLNYLGGEDKIIHILSRKPQAKHVFPFCCLKPWTMADHVTPINNTNASTTIAIPNIDTNNSHQPNTNANPSNAHDDNKTNKNNDLATEQMDHNLNTNKGMNNDSVIDESSEQVAIVHTENAMIVTNENHVGSNINHTYFTSFPRSGSSDNLHQIPHSAFLLHTQIGTLQYCVLRPLTAILAFIFNASGVYGEGEFRFDAGYPYLSFIVNCSQIWAMYCLIMFYYALKTELKRLNPVPKFIVVKAVVFFTFWQYCLLILLGYLGIIHETTNYSEDRLTVALQDFIVCLEMSIAAIAHHKAFSFKHFHDPQLPLINQPLFRSLFEVINVTDVYVQDVQTVRKKAFRKKHIIKKQYYNNNHNNINTIHKSQVDGFTVSSLSQPLISDSESSEDVELDSNAIPLSQNVKKTQYIDTL